VLLFVYASIRILKRDVVIAQSAHTTLDIIALDLWPHILRLIMQKRDSQQATKCLIIISPLVSTFSLIIYDVSFKMFEIIMMTLKVSWRWLWTRAHRHCKDTLQDILIFTSFFPN